MEAQIEIITRLDYFYGDNNYTPGEESMSNIKDEKRISKFLSFVLRHKPEHIGIELDENGWTDVQTLVEKVNQNGITLTFELLKHIVDTNSKKRFAFNENFDKIRASQGHSIDVELGYVAQQPPAILYHGTAEKSVNSILEQGLQKQNRHHVHLSIDIETAKNVGQRHGEVFIFEVLSGEMHSAGFEFFLSENGVWLTDTVPPIYLKKSV
ncbi:MAG TPA: RNA 2'-phosphotransferase [Chitinophagaceae bacterium]